MGAQLSLASQQQQVRSRLTAPITSTSPDELIFLVLAQGLTWQGSVGGWLDDGWMDDGWLDDGWMVGS